MSNLKALSVYPCLQLAPGLAEACLRPNLAFVPKVMKSSYKCLTLELLAFHPPPFSSKEDKRLHTLCPEQALSVGQFNSGEMISCLSPGLLRLRGRISLCPINGCHTGLQRPFLSFTNVGVLNLLWE